MVVKISNSSDQTIVASYRMPGQDENGRPSPVIDVVVQPRALLNDVYFATNAHYDEWKRQNQYFFFKNILVEGSSVQEKLLKEKNKENTVEEHNKMTKTSEKALEKIEEAADSANATVHFEAVESAGANKQRRRK